jgi:hypothetical protein
MPGCVIALLAFLFFSTKSKRAPSGEITAEAPRFEEKKTKPRKKRDPLKELLAEADSYVGPMTRSRLKKDQATTKAVAAVRDMLECIVCFEDMSSSAVFACANDHLMCAKCKGNIERVCRNACPACRIDLDRFPLQRRRGYERIFALVNAPEPK